MGFVYCLLIKNFMIVHKIIGILITLLAAHEGSN